MPIPARWSSELQSVLRIVTALGFMHHGISKFFGIPPFPMPLNPLLYTAGTLELSGAVCFCSAFSPGRWRSCCRE